MHSFLDSKHMAKALRQALAERGQEISHSDALELVARQYGFANWNMLAARIEAAQLAPLELPPGWHVAGHTNEGNYRLGIDPKAPGTALIESRPDRDQAIDRAAGETAVLMQSILADPYRGSRLRLTAELRSEAAETATLWMRVDPAEGRYLHFDNLLQRPGGPLAGTLGWTERQIVLDVPETAATIHYGFFLRGSGKAWARRFALHPVGVDVATTEPGPRYLSRPTNLDFGGEQPVA
ncbi:glyoxalase superfamily protein [Devosia sp. LjRoot16]|uniref:glyoxalase superfamily protein n=1 Tax=Devosia sp. LjRoot16 TaxID=3342271 RepID=UPI003ECD1E61